MYQNMSKRMPFFGIILSILFFCMPFIQNIMRNSALKIIHSGFFKNLLTLISASSVAQAIALAVYPVLTRIYTPAEHGMFALYMSIIAITSLVSTGKYELAIMIPSKEKEGFLLTVLSLLLSFVFSLLLGAVIVIFSDSLPKWLGNEDISSWLWLVPVSTFLVGTVQSMSFWNNRQKSYTLIASTNLGQSLTNSAVKLTASSLLAKGGGLVLGAVFGQFTGFILYSRRFLRREHKQMSSIRVNDLWTVAHKFQLFPKYNMLHYLTNSFSSSLPVFMFSSWFSPAEVGFYSLGFMLINRPMNLITNSFTQVFSQRTIEKYNNRIEIRKEIRYVVFRAFLFAVLPFCLLGIFGPRVFSFVLGEDWLEAGKYMRLLLPWLFVVLLSSPLSFLPDMLGKQRKAMYIDLVKFILRIGVLYLGVRTNNIHTAIALFSGISFFLVLYNLIWYLNLSVLADKNSNSGLKR